MYGGKVHSFFRVLLRAGRRITKAVTTLLPVDLAPKMLDSYMVSKVVKCVCRWIEKKVRAASCKLGIELGRR